MTHAREQRFTGKVGQVAGRDVKNSTRMSFAFHVHREDSHGRVRASEMGCKSCAECLETTTQLRAQQRKRALLTAMALAVVLALGAHGPIGFRIGRALGGELGCDFEGQRYSIGSTIHTDAGYQLCQIVVPNHAAWQISDRPFTIKNIPSK